MKYGVYSIRDTAAETFQRPFVARRDAEAVRAFAELANDGEHPVGRHPEQYNLFRIGVFDEETGVVAGSESVHLGVGSSFVQAADPRHFVSELGG